MSHDSATLRIISNRALLRGDEAASCDKLREIRAGNERNISDILHRAMDLYI